MILDLPPPIWMPPKPAIIRSLKDDPAQLAMPLTMGMLSAGKRPYYTYQSVYADANNLTTYTFTGVSIGTAAASRLVVVAFGWRRSTGTFTLNSLTIGGNAATLYVNNANTATIAGVAFGGLVVTSGTTADVVATLSGTAGLTGLGVWAVYNLTNTGSVVASSTDTAAPLNFTALTPQLGDVFLGAAYSNTASTSTLWDWTNLTEDGEIQTEASASPFSVASWQANNTSSLTVTAALTGGAADSIARGTVIQLR